MRARMSYRDLYEFCQTLEPRISRRAIIPKICEITRKPKPRIIVDGISPEVTRGYFISPENADHPFAKFANGPGGSVIVVARGMNYCWTRFVTVKELMHHFDEPLQLVGTAEEFESLVSEFVAPSLDKSDAMRSESLAFWMALAILCPEPHRQALMSERSRGNLTDAEVAERLKVPLQYVPRLFDPNFKRFVQFIISI